MADELNFTNREELEEWLKDKPVEWAQVIAIRIALRVLPFIGQLFGNNSIKTVDQNNMTLLAYRACFISSAARNYPAEDMTYAADAAAYAARADADAAADAAYAAADAAYAAADAARVAGGVAYAARAAADAADAAAVAAGATSRAADAALADIWVAISQDANWLSMQEGAAAMQAPQLSGTQLWPHVDPEWARYERRNLSQLLTQKFEHHIVWIDWYNKVLTGKSFFGLSSGREKTLTLSIAQQPNDFWEQNFTKVSEDISIWLEEARIEDAAEAAQRQLDEEVDHSETSTDNVGNSTLAKSNGSTRLSITQVDQNLLQILFDVKAINESAAGRIANRPLKPNSGEALDNWNAEQDFLTLIEEKSDQISQSLMAMESQSDRQQAVEETSTLLEELFLEFDSFVRTNKKRTGRQYCSYSFGDNSCWIGQFGGSINDNCYSRNICNGWRQEGL